MKNNKPVDTLSVKLEGVKVLKEILSGEELVKAAMKLLNMTEEQAKFVLKNKC